MQSPDISSHIPKPLLQQSYHPQLLVSVRNLTEAKMAVAGGCDVLDIKEPNNGSLGMAETEVINKIAECGTRSAEEKSKSTTAAETFPLVSAALGEVVEREDKMHCIDLSPQLSFLKLGLSGLGNDQDWSSRWMDVRDRIEEQFKGSSFFPQWIAVAYADWKQADAPHPQEILEAAIATNCTGLLIDTFVKDGSTLFDYISEQELTGLSLFAKKHRLLFAVAGSLKEVTLPNLVDVRPDIIAIRSAACRGGNRTEEICQTAIQKFRTVLLEAFQTH